MKSLADRYAASFLFIFGFFATSIRSDFYFLLLSVKMIHYQLFSNIMKFYLIANEMECVVGLSACCKHGPEFVVPAAGDVSKSLPNKRHHLSIFHATLTFFREVADVFPII